MHLGANGAEAVKIADQVFWSGPVLTYPKLEKPCAALVLALALFGPARAETIKLIGDYGYEEYVGRNLEPGSLLDARGATFRVANSKNTSPTSNANCENGPLPNNRYPLRIYDSPAPVLIGGQFDGEVPLNSDWEHTYCNSAAVGLWDSPYAIVEGTRIRRVWDAVRFSNESQLFRLEDVWFSEVRDDCVENDFLRTGLIKDVLFDGCFSGISARPPEDRPGDGSAGLVTLSGVLMRLQPYLYKGEMRHGAPVKADSNSPRFEVYDSVFAIGSAEMLSRSQLEIGWGKISDCRNNVLLWESDLAWPTNLAEPPSCFRILHGERARSLWAAARQNWIDCHFAVARFSDDAQSDPLKCDGAFYGGQY